MGGRPRPAASEADATAGREPPAEARYAAGAALQVETAPERAERFGRVFERVRYARTRRVNATHNGTFTSASGAGSTLAYTTAARRVLAQVVHDFAVKRLLDVPCGDFVRMRHFLKARPALEYVGGDIVRALVDEHSANFADRAPRWRFLRVDAAEALPRGPFDVLLMRDAVQHMSPGDILRVLAHVNASAVRYLLVTHYPSQQTNAMRRGADAARWDTHFPNLCRPPYSLPEPLRSYNDRDQKDLSLFRVPFLPAG
ncbi:hypothetical protein M885DRAFT_626735 [Pelagophyceae sp. CCMP2097]|nr:hypothetical protein M885DRAFT_626735 [Pelagophyceae sp. CCMP2097]